LSYTRCAAVCTNTAHSGDGCAQLVQGDAVNGRCGAGWAGVCAPGMDAASDLSFATSRGRQTTMA